MYKKILKQALEKVVSEQGYQGIVENRNIHEQALSHRLAFHLENSGSFVGYHIDCEYNRHKDDPKIDKSGLRFRPDIIIHTRGNDDNNLLIIETKKFNDPSEEMGIAIQKLETRCQKYKYQYAFLVIFPKLKVKKDSIIEIKYAKPRNKTKN